MAEGGGEPEITAGLLVIGEEILSGRTADLNIVHVARWLTEHGIDLREVRVVGDVEAAIIEAVDALRGRYTYVFTTGGIGPTHDDITAEAIAGALGAPLREDERAVAMLRERFGEEGLSAARLRMARIPAGADLIENPLTRAPGFSVGNVHVLAGVPEIMRAMLEALRPRLRRGRLMRSTTVKAPMPESLLAAELTRLQQGFPDVSIGSYPQYNGGIFSTEIVLRCRDEERLAAVEGEVRKLIEGMERSPRQEAD
jgi:molybdenum cofactor synthesis domain-containing protein